MTCSFPFQITDQPWAHFDNKQSSTASQHKLEASQPTSLEFADEGEGDTFYKKLIHRDEIQLKEPALQKEQRQQPKQHHAWRNRLRRKQIDKELIGSPADFQHKGHIGYTAEHGFSVQGDSRDIIGQLKSLGITAEEIEQNKGFIQEYMATHDNHQQQQRQPPAAVKAHKAAATPSLHMTFCFRRCFFLSV
ncbi:hypothetical protein BDB00DRAFT_876975 [Zychaea mexicana]|uniref:uncharacterized protein n=1 Tax=Zychaea mexicana TaxID=64656 RepID=UPI0022FECFC7|nr:uncharacterized protein BDB00DRAFT_876975 [Zychaea mexicana]KAI9488910.1 hypothetical protein BDB00DRAFT_876975 [Zychaea mexicana]